MINSTIQNHQDFTIKYSQLQKPKTEDKTFLNDLFNCGSSYSSRFKFLFGSDVTLLENRASATCSIKIKDTPARNSYEEAIIKIEMLGNKNFQSYRICLVDKDSQKGFTTSIFYSDRKGVEITHNDIEKNLFSGNVIVTIKNLMLSVLAVPIDRLLDASHISHISTCHSSCDLFKKMNLHVVRIFTHQSQKSWYIGSHGYVPDCGMERYEQSVSFFRNLNLKHLKILKEKLISDEFELELPKFLGKIEYCFKECIKFKILEEKDHECTPFHVLASSLLSCKEENIHPLFHNLIRTLGKYIFMKGYHLMGPKRKKEVLEKVANTEWEHFANMTISKDCSKEIEIMKFS